MNDKAKTAVIVTGAIAAILLLKYNMHVNSNQFIEQIPDETTTDPQSQFQIPFLQTNAGIPDMSSILNGGNTFNSVTNVSVNPSLAMQLNRNYIPLFGFVGIQTVGVPGPVKIVQATPSAKTLNYPAFHADYPKNKY